MLVESLSIFKSLLSFDYRVAIVQEVRGIVVCVACGIVSFSDVMVRLSV